MNTKRTIHCAWFGLLVSIIVSPSSLFSQECDPCRSECKPATCSVLVPQLVTELQTRVVTRFRPERRERMVTVYRNVPDTETIQEEYTVVVPETRTRTVAEKINHPVYGDIQLRTTSMAPKIEPRQGSYTVTRQVAVQEERCESGCFTTAAAGAPPGELDPNAPPAPSGSASPPNNSVAGGTYSTGCNSCGPRMVRVTSWKPVSEQVSVQYPVTRFEPKARLSSVSFYEYRVETKLREEPYVVDVPEKRTRTREVAVTRQVAEQRPEQYTVNVPYQERIEVPVVTRRYVEQQMIVR